MSTPIFEELHINTIRSLVAGMVPRANSGHPGTPMGTSAPGKVLYGKLGLTVQHIAGEILLLLPWRQL